jgi:hypothetical protein
MSETRDIRRQWAARAILVLAAAVWSLVLIAGPSEARPSRRVAPDYYVEFNARMGTPIGHSYVVLATRGRDGKLRRQQSAGFYVEQDPVKLALALIGGAPAVVRPSPFDRQFSPLERYRVKVSAAKYRRLAGFIARTQRNPPAYSLFGTNCNSFVKKSAEIIGLQAPAQTVTMPPDYVAQLRALNQPQRVRR